LEWTKEAEEFLESRRAKLPGGVAEVDRAIEKIKKDSEKIAANAGAPVVEKEHVKQAISGLGKIEIVTEASEQSYAFSKAMGILGGFMFFVGLVMNQWYNRMAKYGEEPAQDVNIFILRWMLWAGLVILAVAAAHFYWQRRSAQAEEEEAEEEEAEPASEAEGESEASEEAQ